jgi:hypothetical protein
VGVGDREDELVARLVGEHDRAYRAAWLVLRDKHLAEEAVQEAFLRVWRFRGSLPSGDGIRPWLYRVVVNTAISSLRHERPRRAHEAAGDVDAIGLDDPLDAMEQASIVADALADLPEAPSNSDRAPLLGRPVGEGDRHRHRPPSWNREVATARSTHATVERPPTRPRGSLMLTEDDLRDLIDAAAGRAPTPSPLPDDLFHIEHHEPSNTRHRRGRPLAFAAALIVVVGFVAAVIPGDQLPFLEQHFIGGGSSQDQTATAPVVGGTAGGSGARAAAAGSAATGAASGGGSGAVGAENGTLGPFTAFPSPAPPLPATAPPADSARIVKNGSLEIGVGKSTVSESVNRFTAMTTGLGGYVSETRTTMSEQSGTQASATVTVRVPSASFEQLMSETSKLGEVRSTTTSGQDVTAQFTDIDAQLTALTATRDQYLLVLGRANNVGDILAVQDRLTQVQIQIDQLEGQKRLLTDQTSFGALSVTLLEPGATAAVAPVDDNKDLGDAWRDARRNFGDALESVVAASGGLAVVLLCGGAILIAGWFAYRSLRRRTLTL